MQLLCWCRSTAASSHQHFCSAAVLPEAKRRGIQPVTSLSEPQSFPSFSLKLLIQIFSSLPWSWCTVNGRRSRGKTGAPAEGQYWYGCLSVLHTYWSGLLYISRQHSSVLMLSFCPFVFQALFADCQAHIWAVEGRKWWRAVDVRSLGSAVHGFSNTCPWLSSSALSNFVKVCVDERRDVILTGSFDHIFCCMVDLKQVPVWSLKYVHFSFVAGYYFPCQNLCD